MSSRKLVAALNAMPLTHAIGAGIAACGAGSFVLCVASFTHGYDSTPSTWRSALWGEATQAYHKFQHADPMTHPEVREKK